MISLAQKLSDVELYCCNQGDKFRPMSDDLLTIMGSSETDEQKEIAVEALCVKFEQKIPYHVGRVRVFLAQDDDEDED